MKSFSMDVTVKRLLHWIKSAWHITHTYKVIIFISIWWLSNLISTISSKEALIERKDNVLHVTTSKKTNGWMELTMFQSAVGGLLAFLWSKYILGKPALIQLSPKTDTTMIFASLANLIGNSATNFAFSIMASSSVQVIKSIEPVFTFVFTLCISKTKGDSNVFTLLSILIITVGSSMFLRDDPTYNAYAIIAGFASNIAFSLRNVFLKREDAKQPLDKFVTISAFSCFTILPLVLFDIIYHGKSIEFFNWTFASSFFHFSYNLASINVLQNISPITHAVLNLCKRAIVVAVNMLYFSIEMTEKMKLGIVVLFLGLALFVYCKHMVSSQLVIRRRRTLTLAVITLLSFMMIFSSLSVVHQIKAKSKMALRSYLFEEVTVRRLNNWKKDSISANESETVFYSSWLYDRPIPDEYVQNMKQLISRNSNANFNIYCGSRECMKTLKCIESNRVTIRGFVLNQIIKDTPFHRWMKRLPLIKIFSGVHFENLLTHVLRLSMLWKYGGIYVDPSYTTDETTAFSPDAHPWIVNSCENILDICYFPKKNHFIWSLSNELVQKYPLDTYPANEMPINFSFAVFENTFYDKYPTTDVFCATNFTRLSILVKKKIEKSSLYQGHYATFSFYSRNKQGANIGDEIQGYPGMQFLPYIDTFVDRQILTTPKQYPTASTTLFFNAWWGNPKTKLPADERVVPKLISIHIQEIMWNLWGNNRTLSYFKDHGPVGTRDTSTLNWLRSKNVESYLSGCMTLFMKNRFEPKDRNGKIYVVDVNKRYMQHIPKHLKYEFIYHEQAPYRKSNNSLWANGYKRIELYSKAKLVITQRIHAALPCVALGTPVIFINSAGMPGAGGTAKAPSSRTSGLTRLFHTLDLYKPISDATNKWISNFNWNIPPPNPNSGLVKVLRARQWSDLRRTPKIHESAIKFGLIPPTVASQPHPSEVIHISVVYDENAVDEGKPKWHFMRSLESILYHHPHSNVTIYSNIIDSSSFDAFTEVGFSITVEKYDVDELRRKSNISQLPPLKTSCKHLGLLKLLVLYINGGVFIESNIILIKPIFTIPRNQIDGIDSKTVSFMKFDKKSDYLQKLVLEYFKIYDQNKQCSSLLPSSLLSSDETTFKQLSISPIEKMNNGAVTDCLNHKVSLDAKFYGVQMNFTAVDNELKGKSITFNTKCKLLFNDYCLSCYKQY